MDQDVLPASPLLGVVSTSVDADQHTVTGRLLGLFPRTAALGTDRGCVLDLPPDRSAAPYVPSAPNPQPWPRGDAAADPTTWPAGTDGSRLVDLVDLMLNGSGDPTQANTRGTAIVDDGSLLVQRDGAGFAPNTALHGWSMSKTVAVMLAWKRFQEVGLDLDTGRELRPLGCRGADALRSTGHGRLGPADHPTDQEPGTTWEYLSAVSNILAQVVRAQFPDDHAYWADPRTALFEPIGASTASVASDTSGTWVGSSYLWASVGDWARIGQLMMQDGRWHGRQVIPAGWWALARTSATPGGEGHGYGGPTWIPAQPVGGACAGTAGLPADTLTMEGHWGQLVAMVPSRRAVVVRLGWTLDDSTFDSCQFVSDVLAALRAS